MLIATSKENDTVIASIGGELDHHTAVYTRKRLDDLLIDQSTKNLVIDLKELHFMDSSGIGVFIGRYKIIASRGGKLAVTGINQHIHKVFEVSGLYRIVKTYGTLQEALEDLKGCSL